MFGLVPICNGPQSAVDSIKDEMVLEDVEVDSLCVGV